MFQPNDLARFKMRLGVIGAPPTWVDKDGELQVYEPYVREMRIWADLFQEVVVCSSAAMGPMRGNLASYGRSNIRWVPVSYTMEVNLLSPFRRLIQLPGLILAVLNVIRTSDFILLRSPSHFGLVGAMLVRILGRRSITKWAGENAPYESERIPSRLNRRIEATFPSKHCVLVYGPPKASNQLSFIPALMSQAEIRRAQVLSRSRSTTPPWQILCVGRLHPVKGFDLAIRGLGCLRRERPDLNWRFTLVGDGTERQFLEGLVREEGIGDVVTFTGALSFQVVQEMYARAHIAIMPGVKEGWPKITVEGWAHGAVTVAARGGIIPWIMREKDSGVIFEPTPGGLARALAGLLDNPVQMSAIGAAACRYAEQLSLEEFARKLEHVLVHNCGLK